MLSHCPDHSLIDSRHSVEGHLRFETKTCQTGVLSLILVPVMKMGPSWVTEPTAAQKVSGGGVPDLPSFSQQGDRPIKTQPVAALIALIPTGTEMVSF